MQLASVSKLLTCSGVGCSLQDASYLLVLLDRDLGRFFSGESTASTYVPVQLEDDSPEDKIHT